MKRVFMTGITGLLGTNLANALLESNFYVTAIVRDPKRYVGKRTANLNLIEMGLFDDYDIYLNEIDYVVHIAAITAVNNIHYSDFEKVNYAATARLFDKAKAHNVSGFIFISSANTIGYGNLKNLGSEGDSIKKPFTKHYYAQTKLKAERYLLENNKNNEVDLKILNPTFMIGPNDSKPSSGKIIRDVLHTKFVFYPPGGKNFVPVKDVVQAIINSFTLGDSSNKFLIAGGNMTYKDFYKRVGRITNQNQILIPVPKFILLLLGYLGSMMRFFGIKTRLSLSNLQALCVKTYYGNQKSKDALQLSYSNIDDAIAESVSYFHAIEK